MAGPPLDSLRGDRVLLRRWRPSDVPLFAALNADAEVMEYFPARMTVEESLASARRVDEHFDAHGYGLWALEVPGEIGFAGFVGLAIVGFEAAFTRAAPGGKVVEIGWRLGRAAWGRGYAAEGARLALAAAFGPLGLREVVSFTVPANRRSWRVMETIGMRRSREDDFEHPMLPQGHPLRPHLFYRITREEWLHA